MGFLKYSYPKYLGYHIIVILFIAFQYRKSLHSLFFIEDTDLNLRKLNDLNRFKVNNARSILEEMTHLSLNLKNNTEHSIVVITTRRLSDDNDKKGIGYLTRVLAHIYLAINNTNSSNINVIVCDVNSDIAVHNEAYELSKYFQTIHRFYDNDTNDRISHSIKDPFHREGLDYSFCLEKTLGASNVKYITVLEDDALLERNSITTLNQHLFSREDWYYAKTYYPLQWKGYAYDLSSIVSLLYLGVVAAFLHTLTMLITIVIICRATNYPLTRVFYKTRLYTTLFSHGFIFTIITALLIGRLNIDKLFGNSLTIVDSSPDCCTPMVVYTRKAAIDIAELLKHKRCTSTNAVDIMISKFAGHETTLLLQPNQIKHIGYLSTIKGFTKYPDYFV